MLILYIKIGKNKIKIAKKYITFLLQKCNENVIQKSLIFYRKKVILYMIDKSTI